MHYRKCKNCHGTGTVPTQKRLKANPDLTRKCKCLYCKGKGHKISYYGAD